MRRTYRIDHTWDPPLVTHPGVAVFVRGEIGAAFGLDRQMQVKPEWLIPGRSTPPWQRERLAAATAGILCLPAGALA